MIELALNGFYFIDPTPIWDIKWKLLLEQDIYGTRFQILLQV